MIKFPENWVNDNNMDFYNSVPVSAMQAFSVRGGLDGGTDIQLLKHYVDSAKTILEVGAGYGRVVEKLLANQACQADIYAVEKSQRFCGLLANKYINNNRVYVSCTDVRTLEVNTGFELILWLWSGISDFAKAEQQEVVGFLVGLLNDMGILAIDTLLSEKVPSNELCDNVKVYGKGSEYIIDANGHVVYGYMPTKEEMFAYVDAIPNIEVEHIQYTTESGMLRNMFIFKKCSVGSNR